MTTPFFGELYLRSTRPFLDAKVTDAERAYLKDAFARVDGPLLDFGCGHGRHLDGLGRPVIGMDFDRGSLEEAKASGSVAQGDFFRSPFRTGAFGGIWAWYNAIFTFEDAQIRAIFAELARLTRPGGLVVVHTLPREKIEAAPASHYSGELPDGCHLEEHVTFDPATGRDDGRRILKTPEGRTLEAGYFIRYYFLHELQAMLEVVGFRTAFVHGGLDGHPLAPGSPELILGAHRG